MRIRILLAALIAVGLGADASHAALKKYKTRHSVFILAVQTSPTRFQLPAVPQDSDQFGTALIDDSGPVMEFFDLLNDNTTTVDVPGLSGFIFVSRKFTEGPGPSQPGVSGSTASQIVWGTLTGWGISGRNWCNSEPATICTLAGDPDELTGPARAPSPFYDLGTWIFHGTGFTSQPFVWSRFTSGGPGDNFTYIVRGAFAQDGTVPALPLAGVALLTGAVALAGLAAFRKR